MCFFLSNHIIHLDSSEEISWSLCGKTNAYTLRNIHSVNSIRLRCSSRQSIFYRYSAIARSTGMELTNKMLIFQISAGQTNKQKLAFSTCIGKFWFLSLFVMFARHIRNRPNNDSDIYLHELLILVKRAGVFATVWLTYNKQHTQHQQISTSSWFSKQMSSWYNFIYIHMWMCVWVSLFVFVHCTIHIRCRI